MTIVSTEGFSPELLGFMDALKKDDTLRAEFTALFINADSNAGKAAIIDHAVISGIPITTADVETLYRAMVALANQGALSDEALDGVGGGSGDGAVTFAAMFQIGVFPTSLNNQVT